MQDLTVGIDIGTTAVKAVAVDAEGTVRARVRLPHPLRVPAPERLEHDAAAAWWEGPRRALRELGVEPAAVAVAAMVPSLTAVGPDGRPVTVGVLYGDERGRTAELALPPGASGEAVGFLRWLAAEVPDARGYWPAQTVAHVALGGPPALDAATAASLYPLFDGTRWDPDLLAGAGADAAQLPEVAPLGAAVGRTASGAVLASGVVDAVGEQLVAGADEVGDVLVICGATLMTWVVTDAYRDAAPLWCIPHTAPGRFLVGGPSNAGGLFLNWVRSVLTEPTEVNDPARVPVWEPYIRGERTPLHDPARRAALHGLDLTHGPGALWRAALEAAGFVVRHHIELSELEARRIVATGGGVRDAGLLQALADATALPVVPVAVPEGAALGAAFVARLAAGSETELTAASRWARHGPPVRPRPEWVAACEHRYQRFRELAGV